MLIFKSSMPTREDNRQVLLLTFEVFNGVQADRG
jgi:hypothetical protein